MSWLVLGAVLAGAYFLSEQQRQTLKNGIQPGDSTQQSGAPIEGGVRYLGPPVSAGTTPAAAVPVALTWDAMLAAHPETKQLPYGVTYNWLAQTFDRATFVGLTGSNPGRKMAPAEAGQYWDAEHFVGGRGAGPAYLGPPVQVTAAGAEASHEQPSKHQRYPDTAVGAPVRNGWTPGRAAPMPWDACDVGITAAIAPPPAPMPPMDGTQAPLSPTRNPGRHVPPPPPLSSTPGTSRRVEPWEGNIGGPRLRHFTRRKLPPPVLSDPWGGPRVAPPANPTALHPAVQLALSWLRGPNPTPESAPVTASQDRAGTPW